MFSVADPIRGPLLRRSPTSQTPSEYVLGVDGAVAGVVVAPAAPRAAVNEFLTTALNLPVLAVRSLPLIQNAAPA